VREVRGVELDDDVVHPLDTLDPGTETSQVLRYRSALARIDNVDPESVVTAVFRVQHEY
jgi:hypothetical protein